MSENQQDIPIKRPRGRPRKEKPIDVEPKIPKKRGRKPKPIDPNKVKRPIGRPRKEKPEVVKRPVGRPRKYPLKDPNFPKRSRGRPRIYTEPKVRKYKILNGDWSNPDYKREYQKLLMRKRQREMRGIKRHIYILDDGRKWSDVKKEIEKNTI